MRQPHFKPMKKVAFIFLLCILIIINIAKGQTLFPQIINFSDNVKILSYKEWYNNSYVFPYIFKDFDQEDNLWVSFYDGANDSLYVCKMDNDLNIKRKIISSNQLLDFKYNHKYYGLRFSYQNNQSYIDSVFFYCSDSLGNNLITKLITTANQDSFIFSNDLKRVFFSKENNIVLMNFGENEDKRVSKIIVIDTLGDIINSKTINLLPNRMFENIAFIDNNDSYALFRSFQHDYYDKGTVLYNIDKQTLNIIDSICFDSVFIPAQIKNINDSIFVSALRYGERISGDNIDISIDIVNIYSSRVKKIRLYLNKEEDSWQIYMPEFGDNIDFINSDSIYYCHFTRNYKRGANYIDIANFSVNGNINFRYRIDYDSTILFKQINGIKATTDGGLVIACTLYGDAWVIKFMPNGFVGLTDIETNEKASIKVYPNPSKNFIYVDIEADRFSSSEIELFDIQGRLVKKSKLNAQIGNRIDVSMLSPGAYTYRVVINGKGISGKVIIGE